MSCTRYLDVLDSNLLVAYDANDDGERGGGDVNVHGDDDAWAPVPFAAA